MIKPGAIYELAPDGRVMLEMQDVMDMVADVRRLEWLGDYLWTLSLDVWPQNETTKAMKKKLLRSDKSWRDGIDEAMRASDEANN